MARGLDGGEAASHGQAVPVVLGPAGRSYILDRHHHLCALAAEGVAEVEISVIDDLRRLEWVGFWRTLDRREWCRPVDSEGRRQDYSYIPTSIDELKDDPYRSHARALRRAGGYARRNAPFSDFVWADFLRDHIHNSITRSLDAVSTLVLCRLKRVPTMDGA